MQERKSLTKITLETSVRAAAPFQLIYTAMGIVFGMQMVMTPRSLLQGEYALAVLVCVWLIHSAKRVLVVLDAETMEVTLRSTTLRGLLGETFGEGTTATVEYRSVVGVSETWRELYVVNRHGGMSVIPVTWHELSAHDRGVILRRFQEAKHES